MFAAAIPVYAITRFFMHNTKQEGFSFTFKKELGFFIFFIYMLCVISLTLMPNSMFVTSRPNTINLVPIINTFHNFYVVASIESNQMIGNALGNIVGNILLFFPLGVLLPLLFPTYSAIKQLFIAASTASLSIEFIQFLEGVFGIYRSVDIDDVILNTLGALVGYFAYIKIVHPRVLQAHINNSGK